MPQTVSADKKKIHGKNTAVREMYLTMQHEKSEGSRNAVLILANHAVAVCNVRMELIKRLIADGYEVHVSCPSGSGTDSLTAMGVRFHKIKIDRHGMNPFAELSVLNEYRRLVRSICPAVVLTYTIKPNIYGGIAAGEAHIPYIANITGLGSALEKEGIKRVFLMLLYKAGLYHAQKVFFQNRANRHFMLKHRIVTGPHELLPGSGVNLEKHSLEEYPGTSKGLVFLTAGRIMKDKGTDELLEAAAVIKKRYPDVRFCLTGFFDDDYREKIASAVKEGLIEYTGQQNDMHPYFKNSHALIHPSHHEGMSNAILEAASTGRPVLASRIPGCREAFDEGVSGFGFRAGDSASLVRAIEKFIRLSSVQKAEMGKAGRRKMEREFDRQTVVEKYMREINRIRRRQDGFI